MPAYQGGKMSVKAKNFYRRALPSSCVDFSSEEGKQLFKESLLEGNANIYFRLAAQFRTQDEPAYCGLSTLGYVMLQLRTDSMPLIAFALKSNLGSNDADFATAVLSWKEFLLCDMMPDEKEELQLCCRKFGQCFSPHALCSSEKDVMVDKANNYRDSAESLSKACRTVCSEVRQTSIAGVFSSSAVAALMLAWPFE
ncbi:hypothetical protein ANCCEY_14198, partial [Ancylostoma ceylanicum]